MLIVVPALAFLLTYALIAAYQKKTSVQNTPLAILFVILFTSAFVFTSTEVLSLCNALNTFSLQLSWAFYLVAAGVLCIKTKPPFRSMFRCNIKLFFREHTFLKLVALLSLAVTFLISITAYPNTWDSMTYHLARIMHWLQNANTEHYPTAIDRQVAFQPLAEYWMMHFMCVSGTDKMANLVQWMFFGGSICAGYLIAAELGAGKKGKYLAVFFVSAIPMALLQSSSTQTDLAEGFFICTSILFLLKCLQHKFATQQVLLFALSVALACITKGTAYIYLLPLLFVFAVSAIVIQKTGAIKTALISICIIIFFNGLYWYRNFETYKYPLGQQYELNNKVISLNGFISNVSRNIAMHLRLPVAEYNDALNNSVKWIHEQIHTNLNAKNYTWPATPPFENGKFTLHEDSAGSFLHVLMFLLLFPLLFFSYRKRNRLLVLTAAIVLVMFFLFCLILRWQVWHVRLHLPMLLAGSVVCACVCENMHKKFTATVCILLFLYSLPFVFYNYSRPLVGPKNIFYKDTYNQYFFNKMAEQRPFFDMSAVIQRENLKNIAWVVTADAWEYPMWVLLQNEKNITMQHVLVNNPTKKLETEEAFAAFMPDAIITTTLEPDSLGQVHYKNADYFQTYKSDKWKLYVKTE